MPVKTRRIPWIGILAIAALVGGGLFAVTTSTRPEDSRVVRFYAHWRPVYVKAKIIQMGSQGSMETSRDDVPTFQKTRNVSKGDIAVLIVMLPPQEDFSELRCNIKVGAEAPKWGTVAGNLCTVEKYVS